jgi:hypothetical protein
MRARTKSRRNNTAPVGNWTPRDTHQLILVGSHCGEHTLRENEGFEVLGLQVGDARVVRKVGPETHEVDAGLVFVH